MSILFQEQSTLALHFVIFDHICHNLYIRFDEYYENLYLQSKLVPLNFELYFSRRSLRGTSCQYNLFIVS